MDPVTAVGLATSITGLLVKGAQVIKRIYSIYQEARELPENLERCLCHVKSLIDIVTGLQIIISKPGVRCDEARIRKVKKILDECQGVAESLGAKAVKIAGRGGRGLGTAVRAALWDIVNDEELQRIDTVLGQNEHMLLLNIDLLILGGGRETREVSTLLPNDAG